MNSEFFGWDDATMLGIVIRPGKGTGTHGLTLTRRHRLDGFTLIEIMVVLAILGILVAVALPAYTDSRIRAARADGKTALMQVASDQERFFSNNFNYSTNALPLAVPPQATVTSRDGHYEVSVAACASGTIATCFIATATPQDTQVADTCGNLTITSAGVRAAAGGTNEDCWQR